MWFRSGDFVCWDEQPVRELDGIDLGQSTASLSGASFFEIYLAVALPCMLWGAGTAIGEVPPYLVSYAAAEAGRGDEELKEITGEDDNGLFHKMKMWMVYVIQRYGFWAIFFLAAWPNMAFDLCGICCGAFRMPFWTFFGATLLGKGVVKVNMQAVFFITLFSESHLKTLLHFVSSITPSSWALDVKMESVLHQALNKFHSARNSASGDNGPGAPGGEGIAEEGTGANYLSILWMIFTGSLILIFVASCINQFAQGYARELLEPKTKKFETIRYDEVEREEDRKHK